MKKMDFLDIGFCTFFGFSKQISRLISKQLRDYNLITPSITKRSPISVAKYPDFILQLKCDKCGHKSKTVKMIDLVVSFLLPRQRRNAISQHSISGFQ